MIEGDEEALGLLYDRWSGEVYSVAFRILCDEQDGEEIVEDTFWQAWRQADRFDSARGTAGGWLLTIARSRALDRCRRRERATPTGGHLTGGDVDSLAAGSETLEIEQTERTELILEALQKLPDEQRKVVEMAYYRGFSQAEIAQGTGQALGTVKARTRLALEKLRKHLFMLRTYD
ncbi:sigma-70 family RNA polymerase sigma factor [soil metagenome]